MSENATRSLNHFGVYALTTAYWCLPESEQAAVREAWVSHVGETAEAVHHYQTYPMEHRADFIVWSAIDVDSAKAPAAFFESFARATHPFRRYVDMTDALWGMTRPSQYSTAKSSQEINPFEPRTLPYLIMYPFTKNVDWYLMKRDARQGMMNEHMRIGKQYREISQLLLYSFGLQDQEFVVVYETDDLAQFSKLVAELRETEARRFTKQDTPLHAAILRLPEQGQTPWP